MSKTLEAAKKDVGGLRKKKWLSSVPVVADWFSGVLCMGSMVCHISRHYAVWRELPAFVLNLYNMKLCTLCASEYVLQPFCLEPPLTK